MENFGDTSEINPELREGTLQSYVYHIKGKIIEGCSFNAKTNAYIGLKFNSINLCCQQKERLTCILYVDKKVV